MDTKTVSILADRPTRLTETISEQAHEFMVLGRQQDWDVAVLGIAPVPTEPVYLGDWMIVPSEQDTTPLPAHALQKVQTMYAAGLRPTRWITVHETPRLLAASPHERLAARSRRPSWDDVAAKLHEVSGVVVSAADKATPVIWEVTKAVGKVALVAAGVAVTGLVACLGLAVMAAASIDPILIACFELSEDQKANYPEGSLVMCEVDRWWVET